MTMIVTFAEDFDADKFLRDLDAEPNSTKKMQAITSVVVVSVGALAGRAEVNKYATAEVIIAHLAMMIAVETRKEYAIDSLKSATDLVKCYEQGSKH